MLCLCRFEDKYKYVTDKQGGERINMQLMNTGNNFWNVGHTTTSTFGLHANTMRQPKVKVAPFSRLNQTRMTMKGMPGFMSDGTALNMGDPNSMRD